ncbi:hypothetical protein H8S18_10420 [Christensenella sp. NSJ-35]|uniref:Uncharacterized protein n=1 Tax=Christensenella tenuis TaxID=2763033 RepID=A0ABR7EG58_9FIRM|nr:hypothetical protein [Christensenella tenuis]MBC5648750.1 hypothetical protein [Christensenella tenuis]
MKFDDVPKLFRRVIFARGISKTRKQAVMDAVFHKALKVCADREVVLSLEHTAANIPEQSVKVIPKIICNGIGYNAEKTVRKGKF